MIHLFLELMLIIGKVQTNLFKINYQFQNILIKKLKQNHILLGKSELKSKEFVFN
jgi:hypothetical protein